MLGAKRLWINRELRVIALVILMAVAGTLLVRSHHLVPAAAMLAGAAAIGACFLLLVVRPARIPANSSLTLRLAGAIPEDVRRAPLEQLFRRNVIGMRQLRYGLEAIVTDRKVSTVLVQISGVEAGLATAHEIHRLLRAVAEAGKRVIAVLAGDSPTLSEYLIAAGASEVVLNPDAMLMMLGVAMGSPFLREALDRIGIRAQTLQWKEYKGAAEMLSRDSMSAELRESLEAIVADREKVVIEVLRDARKLPEERARELLSAGFLSARAAKEAGLIDREGYVQDIRAELDPDGKRKREISFGRYLRRVSYLHERGDRARIAVVFGVGPVIAGEAPPAGDYISGENTAEELDRASRDRDVRAIVFRINSPGGSAVGSEMVWRAVRQAQERGKPVIVSMGDVAGSGGYYVAMGADAVVAEPATITGSIGVVYVKLDMSRMLSNVGVRFEYAKSAEVSDALSVSRAMTERELAQLNAAIGEVYGNFTAKVSQGRKLAPEATEAVARGRVWSGIAARERGLVDETGGFGRAVEIARQRAHIPADQPHRLVSYSARERLFSIRSLLNPIEVSVGSEFAGGLAGMPMRYAPALFQLLRRGGVLMLGPFLCG
jgi:protease-4